MTHRHYTPADVATVLATHAPAELRSLLEPAVGEGDLLAPFVDRFSHSLERVECVDVDGNALRRVRERFHSNLGQALHLVEGDYLELSSTKSTAPEVDCVVMNPPFAAKRAAWVFMHPDELVGWGIQQPRFVPIEVAFAIQSLRRLRHGGRLLAILPYSVIAADGTAWFRRALFASGSVRYVHELPPRTFAGVESRFYLFVFEKGAKQASITLLNHDLLRPERFKLRNPLAVTGYRLDYGYVTAEDWIARLGDRTPELRWTVLGDYVEVLRGDAKSPEGKGFALHTCDYHEGFWSRGGRSLSSREEPTPRGRVISHGDILMKRVGRNCSSTIGLPIDCGGAVCTDCVLILRPQLNDSALPILFALRTVLAATRGKHLLERGTGAAYVTERALLELPIPMRLAELFHSEYHAYRSAVESQQFDVMLTLEKRALSVLQS